MYEMIITQIIGSDAPGEQGVVTTKVYRLEFNDEASMMRLIDELEQSHNETRGGPYKILNMEQLVSR